MREVIGMIAPEMTHSTIDIEGLGKRVRHMRDLLGMSQWDLAVKANIPQSTIHKIETGKTTAPRVDTLEAIAEALGTSLRTLLWKDDREGGDPESNVDDLSVLLSNMAPNTPVTRVRRFVRLYDMMSQHKRTIIEELMEVMAADPAQTLGDAGHNEEEGGGGGSEVGV
jgi:transcriptional regulator with XRE-family HTH domain